MISKNVEQAINKQINAEMYSAYLYLSMSADLEDKNLTGFANWMKIQAQEEMTHAMKFYSYLNERGGRVILEAIEKPKSEWKKPVEIFKEAYNHEIMVTSLINNIMDVALKEKDHATTSVLQWFVDEQVEEEANADEIVKKLELIGDDPHGLFMVDSELGKRVFVDSTKPAN